MVTIIIPVYNAEKYISAAIDSVRAQTHTDWELLLVDDASTDRSLAVIRDILARLPAEQVERIRVFENTENKGPARSRNLGLDMARGRYIAFLDADDVWTADKLERQMDFMQKTGAAFTFTAYEFGDEAARGNGRIVHVPPSLCYREALSRTVISTITTLFDLEGVDKALLKMPDVMNEDTATWWQILRHGHVAHGLDEVCAIYRRHPGTRSANKRAAARNIWRLYRSEGLSLSYSVYCFIIWAVRATLRRL